MVVPTASALPFTLTGNATCNFRCRLCDAGGLVPINGPNRHIEFGAWCCALGGRICSESSFQSGGALVHWDEVRGTTGIREPRYAVTSVESSDFTVEISIAWIAVNRGGVQPRRDDADVAAIHLPAIENVANGMSP